MFKAKNNSKRNVIVYVLLLIRYVEHFEARKMSIIPYSFIDRGNPGQAARKSYWATRGQVIDGRTSECIMLQMSTL